jgi:photosystem II stability/assembly factor-like uncharacterized protein
MRSPLLASLIVLLVLLAFPAETKLRAQWKNVAPNLLGKLYTNGQGGQLGGASCYKDGTLWFGKNDLWMSGDNGVTWSNITPFSLNGVIYSIDFLDAYNGLVSTEHNQVLITTDGGMTWTDISPPTVTIYRAFFIGSAKRVALGTYGGLKLSDDGGATYAPTSISGVSVDGHSLGGGSAYALGDGASGKFIYFTKDSGLTWRRTSEVNAFDCWSFDFDKCDNAIIYLVNESAVTTTDGECHMFVSYNAGASWIKTLDGPINTKTYETYLSGSVSSAENATYVQTSSSGILRSVDHGQTWKSIGGPNMGFDTRFVVAATNNILFAADSAGSIWATYNSGGGDPVPNLPATGILKIHPLSLFDSDTLQCGDSLIHTIGITRSGCITPEILSWKIIGADSQNYSTSGFTYDSLSITFLPKLHGAHSALLVFMLSDSTLDTVALHGFNTGDPFVYSFNPPTLFSGDTLQLCDTPKTGKIFFTVSGCLPKILSDTIIGFGARNYHIIKPAHDPLLAGDSVLVIFEPQYNGSLDATYELTFDNGKKISVLLAGTGKVTPFTSSFSPATLFSRDTLYLCSPLAHDKAMVFVHGCPLPKVISQLISGPASSDYSVSKPTQDSIGTSDSLVIDFKPVAGGSRLATCTLTFADGSELIIPLAGFCYALHPLALKTSDQVTNIIGDEVDVPLTITGLNRAEDIDIILHYDLALKYLGSVSPANSPLDIPGEAWPGRSKLHVANALPDIVLGNARFIVYGDSAAKLAVTFDSVSVLTLKAPCEYISPAAITGNITPPSGCGDPIISHYLRYGTLPTLSIVPNPASTDISISSSADLGEANITIYDMLGSECGRTVVTLKKNSAAKLPLPLTNGIYDLRVKTLEKVWDLQVVVRR